jgi:uncharacterized peroxidase-related enzyme
MARIEAQTIETAPEASRPLLELIQRQMGMVPNLYATVANAPAALEMLLRGTEALAKGKLSAREIELVNTFTSELNGCGYCVSAHAMLGKRAGLSQAEIDGLRDGQGATAREQAILNLVRRVVRTGGASSGADLSRAREAGLSDGAVIEILAHLALKTFTTAVAAVAQTEIDVPKQPRLPAG